MVKSAWLSTHQGLSEGRSLASDPCAPQAAPWQDYDYDAALDAAVEGVHAAQRQHLAAQDQHRMLRLIVSGAP